MNPLLRKIADDSADPLQIVAQQTIVLVDRIDRLESQLRARDGGLRRECELSMEALANAGFQTPEYGYGTNVAWAMSELIRAVTKLSQQRNEMLAAMRLVVTRYKWPVLAHPTACDCSACGLARVTAKVFGPEHPTPPPEEDK